MFSKTKTGLMGLTMLASIYLNAQEAPAWSRDFTKAIVWQKVYASGDYIVSNYDNFRMLDQATGKDLWTNSTFAGVEASDVKEVEGTSLLEINKDGSTFLLDPFSGLTKFDSKNEGITDLEHKQILGLAGCLFVGGKYSPESQKMMAVDLGTGKLLWELKEDFGKIISLNELNPDEFLMVTLFDSYRINSKTGKVVWKKKNSQEAEKIDNMGKFGALMKDVASAHAKDMDFNIQFYLNKDKDVFVIGSESEERTTTPDGKETVKYKTSFQGFKISSGERVWEKPLEIKGQFGDFAFDGNDVIIFPNDGNLSKNYRYELGSKSGKWGKKGRGIKSQGGVYNHKFTDQGILLVSKKGNKDLMTIVDPATGMPKFKKPVKISGEVQNTFSVGGKVFYQTSRELNIIDPVSGALTYGQSIYTTPQLTIEKEGALVVFDNADGLVKSVSLTDGSVKNLSSESFKLGGKESISNIELRGEEIFLSSDQNVVLIGADGKVKFNKYYEAPKVSGLKQALLYAQAARAAYIGVKAYDASYKLNKASQELKGQNENTSNFVGELGDAYGEYGNQASAFAQQSIQQAKQRFSASTGGRDFVIILAKADKGNSLIKLSKATGEILKEVSLGREKNPNYAVDEVTGNIFLNPKTARLVGYKL